MNDDLCRIDADAGEVAVQGIEALLGREAVGQRAQPRLSRVDREHGQGRGKQKRRRRHEADEWAAHDAADERRPEAALGAGAVDRPAADHRDLERVYSVAEQAQHGGQQRQRRDHRDDADEDRAERETAQDRVRHQQHPAHREHESHAAEEHSPARGRPGGHDRVGLLQPAPALFPEPREDEERVVDPEREPHRRDHVHHEERDLERLADERSQCDRDHDREQAEQDRHEARHDRPEHEHEDDQRRRQPDQQLALLQVLLGELLEVGVGRQGAGDRDLETVLPVRGCYQVDERNDLVPLRHDGHHRRVTILRDERLVLRAVVAVHGRDGTELLCALVERPHHRLEGRFVDCVAIRAHDHDLTRSRLGREALVDQRIRLLRLGVARNVAVGRQRAPEQHRDHDERREDGGAPHSDGPLRMNGTCTRKTLSRERHSSQSSLG